MRCPVNNSDYETMYENLIEILSKHGESGDVLSWVEILYKKTIPPLEAQQGEEGYTWRLCGKEDKVLSNVITATTKAIAEHPELFGYSRPSQSASREIKEAFKALKIYCRDCNGSGGIQISEDEVQQCQWCHEFDQKLDELITRFAIGQAESRMNECDDLLKAKKSGWDDCIKFYKINESSQSKECEVCHTRWVMCDCEFKEEMKKASQSVGMDEKLIIRLEATLNASKSHLDCRSAYKILAYEVEKLIQNYKPNAGRQG